MDITQFKFARTIWADKALAKLCPGNNLQRINEVLQSDDNDKQFEFMQKMVLIMHQAYDKKEKFEHPEHEAKELTMEMLDNMTEDELVQMATMAFADFKNDGKTTVEAKAKKKEEEMTEST